VSKKYIQLYSGQWSPIYDKGYHECCECSLVHTVKYRLYDGVLFEMWTVNKSETAKARRKKPNSAKNSRR
jgi:hypothetical protein